MSNANPHVRGTQRNHIPPLVLGLALSPQGFALGLQGFMLGPRGFMFGPPGFLDTNMSLALGVVLVTKPQREWVRVLVKYRLLL